MLAFLEETIRSAGKVCLESSPEARQKDVIFKGGKTLPKPAAWCVISREWTGFRMTVFWQAAVK